MYKALAPKLQSIHIKDVKNAKKLILVTHSTKNKLQQGCYTQNFRQLSYSRLP